MNLEDVTNIQVITLRRGENLTRVPYFLPWNPLAADGLHDVFNSSQMT